MSSGILRSQSHRRSDRHLVDRDQAHGRQSRIPYGVFLASGCAVAVFAGPELLRPFTNYTL